MPFSDGPIVELVGNAENNGLASMVGSLIQQNLEDKPALKRDLNRARGRVALIAQDVDVSLTLHFTGGRLEIFDGILGLPDVTLRTGSDEIVALSLLESNRLGLPDPRGENIRKVFKALREGRFRIYGLLGNLPLVMHMSKLMAV